MNNYEWLIGRLDAFIRKFYINQLLRGFLVLLIAVLFYAFIVSAGEYYLYLPVWLKILIDAVFLLVGGTAMVIWIILPLFKIWRLGRTISHEQAAAIIGRHFIDVDDKLLNILQLKNNGDDRASRELADASITQKVKQISIVPFQDAIDLSKNRRFLPYLLPLLLMGIFILVAAPNIFTQGSARLLEPTHVFEKPAPFHFILKTSSLIALRNSDFTITVDVEGKALPQDVFIATDAGEVPMQPVSRHSFQYTFRNVIDPISFRFLGSGFFSRTYSIQVAQKPELQSMKVQIEYPFYTGHKNEIRNSLSDMTLPVGTVVRWMLITSHTDNASISFGAGHPITLSNNGPLFAYQFRFMNDTDYSIKLGNKESSFENDYHYHVRIIPDQFPVVQAQQHSDSVTGKQIVITGTAGDDYGITRVLFHYSVAAEGGSVLQQKSIPIAIVPGAMTGFQQYFDVGALNLQPGQKVSYYVEAWDNDAVHGSKAARSDMMTYEMYDKAELDSAINANARQINSGMSNSQQHAQQLQQEYSEMQNKMVETNSVDWQQKQSLEQMMQKQQALQDQVENIKKRFDDQITESQQKKYSDDVKDKQSDLEKQLDNLLNNELKGEMKKLQDLMAKLNKDQTMQTMQQMEQDNKLFKMDMERMEALMKNLELQMRMEDLADKMDDLAKKQLELKDKTDGNKKSDPDLANTQQQIKDQLDKAMNDDMKSLKQLNDKVDQKQQLGDDERKGKNAQQDMKSSKDQLSQGQNKKSSQDQDQAAKNLEDMANSMRTAAGGMSASQVDIDIRATRQILTNLIRLSFDQEDLMDVVKHTSPASQEYVAIQEKQNRLHSNSYLIRDSLFSLSKRLYKLSSTINKETTELEHNMQLSVDALENRSINEAYTRQQYVMTHTNNLALMLNETLANLLQMKMKMSGKPGAGSCDKPGGMKPKPGGSPSASPGDQLSDIITQQQQLGNMMQQLENGSPGKSGKGKQGKGDHGQQQGQGSGSGQNGGGQNGNGQGDVNSENDNAEQVARLAEEQAEIRRKLQALSSLLNSKGITGVSKNIQAIEEQMNNTETDLVNRRWNRDFLNRQRDIQTHLLEAQNAVREQEQDDERTSRSGKDVPRPVPPELQKYLSDQKQLLELYRTAPAQLRPYYRQMVENYYHLIGSN